MARTMTSAAAIYHVFAKELVQRGGYAYPCFCTEEELAEMHAAAGGK